MNGGVGSLFFDQLRLFILSRLVWYLQDSRHVGKTDTVGRLQKAFQVSCIRIWGSAIAWGFLAFFFWGFCSIVEYHNEMLVVSQQKSREE